MVTPLIVGLYHALCSWGHVSRCRAHLVASGCGFEPRVLRHVACLRGLHRSSRHVEEEGGLQKVQEVSVQGLVRERFAELG